MKYTNTLAASILIKCPEGHEHSVEDHEVDSTSDECDLCGTHGDVEVTWKCEECNKGYIYTIKSW